MKRQNFKTLSFLAKFRLFQFSVLFLFLGLQFINCSSPNFDSQELATSESLKYHEGQVFDGKLRILHHYVDNFTCEGRPQPESILIRDNETDWYLIRNTTEKCAFVDRLPVQGVQYNESLNQANYGNELYIPPRPYFVNAAEDPNLSDVRIEDGVCEDLNGICSLKASIDQAGATSLTEAVLVHVPTGTYALTNSLVLQRNSTMSKEVTIRGADPLSTILDGGNSISPLAISMTIAAVSIENLTIQNGKGSQFVSSAISPGAWMSIPGGRLDITNCILKTNKGGPTIYGGPGTGNLRIRKSQFIGNEVAAVEVYGVESLLVEDTTIANTDGYGLHVSNYTSNVTVRRSTISSNTMTGISFNRCSSCLIENVTVSYNQQDGVRINALISNGNYDATINNSTIVENGTSLSGAGNIKMGFFDSTNKLFLNNSILAMNDVSRPNCTWNPGNPNNHKMISSNSIIDDQSCEQTGIGNILANPRLGPLTNNGGLTSTMLPLTGSPAIDAGANNLCSSEDQRGLARPIDKLGTGLRCDIGSVEQQ